MLFVQSKNLLCCINENNAPSEILTRGLSWINRKLLEKTPRADYKNTNFILNFWHRKIEARNETILRKCSLHFINNVYENVSTHLPSQGYKHTNTHKNQHLHERTELCQSNLARSREENRNHVYVWTDLYCYVKLNIEFYLNNHNGLNQKIKRAVLLFRVEYFSCYSNTGTLNGIIMSRWSRNNRPHSAPLRAARHTNKANRETIAYSTALM